MASPLTAILNSINKKSEFLDEETIAKDYAPFIVNRGLSYFIDTVLFANEMNMAADVPKFAQYQFYYHALTKRSRFSKWHKKIEDPNIDIIKEYYSYSEEKAEAALKLLSKEQIAEIRQRLYKGGKSK